MIRPPAGISLLRLISAAGIKCVIDANILSSPELTLHDLLRQTIMMLNVTLLLFLTDRRQPAGE